MLKGRQTAIETGTIRKATALRVRVGAKGIACLAFGALALGGIPSAAQAQTTSFLPVRLKLGVLTPQDGDARNIAGSPLYAAEADLALPAPGTAKTFASIGYQERRAHGDLLRVVPITVAKVFSLPNPGAAITGNVYYGAGAGVYLLRATKNGDTKSQTRLGGFGVAGYQFPGSFFVEAKYQLVSGGVRGVYPNGVMFFLGKTL